MSLILSGTDGLSDIDGTAATPAIRGTDANTGIFFGTDIIGFSEGGVEAARINADSQFVAAAGTAALPVITTTGDTNTGIFFPAADTIAFAEGGAEVMRIDSDGDVGIGTTTPNSKLTSQTATTSTSVFSFATQLNNSSGAMAQPNDGIVALGFHNRADVNATGVGGAIAFSGGGVSAGSGNLVFCIKGTGGIGNVVAPSDEKMRIDSSGNLLVGTTSTSVTSGGYNFLINDGGTGYSTGYIGHATGAPSGYAYLNFKYAGTTIGTITQNGTTAVAYNTSSDYRLKNTIAPMTGAIAKVQALKPVTYKWNADGSDGEGFIAHELAEVCPSAVAGEKDAVDADGNPKYQGVDTSFLVATLTAAIQEQQALITALTARITALETQNADNPPQGETP
jgi:hypothetical protein